MTTQMGRIAWSVAFALAAGCSGGGSGGDGGPDYCAPGDKASCLCENGLSGTHECTEDGDGWGECDCTNATPPCYDADCRDACILDGHTGGDCANDICTCEDDTGTDSDTDSDSDTDTTPECSSGDCCDLWTYQYRPSDYACNAWEEYECSGGSCGGTAEQRTVTQYCTGYDSYCGGSTSYGSWTALDACAADEPCESDGSSYAQCGAACAHGCSGGACYPECNPGDPCCDSWGYVASISTVCQSSSEYRCAGLGCGSDPESRTVTRACDGIVATCSGSITYGAWLATDDCAASSALCETDGATYALCNHCGTAAYCDVDACAACDTPTHCGASCTDCTATFEICSLDGVACVECNLSDECDGAEWCDGNRCEACDGARHCGTDCADCTATDQICDLARTACVDPGSEAASRIVPDTGQAPSQCTTGSGSTWSYVNCTTIGAAEALYGQDGHYEAAARQHDYTNNGDGTVTDNVTGLEWQRCQDGLTGANCGGGTATLATWADAGTYCDGLDLGGHQDWRLPGLVELLTLIDASQYNPVIDDTAFPGVPPSVGDGPFWTATTTEEDVSLAWQAHFATGNAAANAVTGSAAVRCVRTAQWTTGPFQTAEIAGDRVVYDESTGLMWQGCLDGASGDLCETGAVAGHDWAGALAACEASSWAGFDDWRLPDRNELMTIFDHASYAPAADPAAFPGLSTQWVWSSSTVSSPSASGAWAENAEDGAISQASKSMADGAVRCVRGGP